MIATAVMTLNGHEGHSPLADFFKCNPSNICAAFYTISTESVLAWFLCTSRASCLLLIFTVRAYARAVLGVVILSVRPSVCPSVC